MFAVGALPQALLEGGTHNAPQTFCTAPPVLYLEKSVVRIGHDFDLFGCGKIEENLFCKKLSSCLKQRKTSQKMFFLHFCHRYSAGSARSCRQYRADDASSSYVSPACRHAGSVVDGGRSPYHTSPATNSGSTTTAGKIPNSADFSLNLFIPRVLYSARNFSECFYVQ